MTDKERLSSGEEENTDEYMIYCHLCKTGFSGTVPYRQHLKGTNHQKAEKKKFMKEKYGPKYLEELDKLKNGGEGTSNDAPIKAGPSANDDGALVFTCDVCKVVCTGEVSYKLHLASKKHAKHLAKQDLIAKLKNKDEGAEGKSDVSPYDALPQQQTFASCAVCKKSFTGPESYKQHLDSQVHQKEVLKKKLLQGMDENGEGDEDGHFVECTFCKKAFSGPIPYQQHLLSDGHSNKLKEFDLAKQLNHVVVDDDFDTVQCPDCGKNLNGIAALYQHVSGPAHAKQKKRAELLRSLHSKFPEFLVETEAQKDGDSDGESDLLLCTTCHKCFSGPESARDHFRSKKHLKVQKEKNRIELLKAERKRKQIVADGNQPSNPPATKSKPGTVESAGPTISKVPASNADSNDDNFVMI